MNSTSQTHLNTAQPPSRHTFSAKEKDTETGYSYFGARYYDSDISVWLSVDPMSDENSSISPYNYCHWNPVMLIDPDGMNDWEPLGNGKWKAEAGDSPGSLARDAKISPAEANSAVKSANQDRGQARTSETMVYKDDVVNVKSRPGYVWSSGSSTTNSSTTTTPSTPSNASNTSGSSSNPVQTVNTLNNVAGIVVSATEQTLQNTRMGANIAYAISSNRGVINGVTNGFKYAPYVGLAVTVLTGYYNSTQINPATNQPYQSWAETGTDIGANVGIIYLGVQYGGWIGAGAATTYIIGKAAVKTALEHPESVQLHSASVHVFTH